MVVVWLTKHKHILGVLILRLVFVLAGIFEVPRELFRLGLCRMDFDEYEYLENTVENPEHKRVEDKKNGGDGIVDYEEKDRSRSSKHRSDDDVDDLDRASKRSKSRKESSEHEKDRSSRHGASSRDREKGERDRHTSSREHRIRDKEENNGKERNRDRDRERDSDRKRNGNRDRRERDPERDRNKEEELERSKRSRNHPERHHEEKGREKSRDVETVDIDFKERRRERVPREDHENR